MRPNRRAHGKKQRQQRQTPDLVGNVEIAVDKQVRERTHIPVPQIHQQESEVVENVGGGHLLIEFEAVEQHRLAVDLHDVAQMQIAMAEPHAPVALTLVHERLMAFPQGARGVYYVLNRLVAEQPARVGKAVAGPAGSDAISLSAISGRPLTHVNQCSLQVS